MRHNNCRIHGSTNQHHHVRMPNNCDNKNCIVHNMVRKEGQNNKQRTVRELLMSEDDMIQIALAESLSEKEKKVHTHEEENITLDKYVEKMVDEEICERNKDNDIKINSERSAVRLFPSNQMEQSTTCQTMARDGRKESTKINQNCHCIFVVGRGRNTPNGYLNLPLNPILSTRNVIYIDQNPDTNPDINDKFQNVDFSYFGICGNQDVNEMIRIKILFDLSTIYCGILDDLCNIISMNIGRYCDIYVPLNNTENDIPEDIKRSIKNEKFTLSLVYGAYPLFDWRSNADISDMKKQFPNYTSIANVVNPNKYIKITAFDDIVN